MRKLISFIVLAGFLLSSGPVFAAPTVKKYTAKPAAKTALAKKAVTKKAGIDKEELAKLKAELDQKAKEYDDAKSLVKSAAKDSSNSEGSVTGDE